MIALKKLALVAPALLLLAACSKEVAPPAGEQGKAGDSLAAMTGTVRVDGSSTVLPISEAVAEEFRTVAPNVRVTVASSGTGGGFKKFMAGETDINDASRKVKAEEVELGKTANIEYIELAVAYDGLSVVVNKSLDFVDHLSVEELKKIWSPESKINNWKEVRAGFPDRPLHLFGPGTDSGTFDYFTEVVNGKSGASRADYTASEDDNILVQGVAGDEGGLGFFGFAYYEASADKLKLVPIDGGKGPVAPNTASISDGSYSPLSRPLFIYVSKAAAKRPEVRAFVDFYIKTAPSIAKDVGYIAMPAEKYEEGKTAFAAF